jgi:hypothetical protein
MMASLYTERELQLLWERQLFRRGKLLTEDAQRVEVEFPGVRSGEGGPDFRGARIAIGGVPRRGDVELHLTPAGWKAHGHDRDGAYAGVILHVVLRRLDFSEAPGGVPLLVLEPYLHVGADPLRLEDPDDLDALGDAWFAARQARLSRELERRAWDEVLYREVLIALGYKHNKAAMAELARRRALASLGGGAGAIEEALLAAAEAMPREMWRLRNVRPANHPWRRLGGMARFLAAARGEGLARGLEARAGSVEAMAAWLDPDGTGQIGPARAREIALNVFLPLLGRAAWERAAELPAPALPPAVAALVPEGRVTTVRRYFGALRRFKRLEFSLAAPPGGC